MKIRVLTRSNEMKIARRPRYATSILSQDECKFFNRTISYVNVVIQGIESLVGLGLRPCEASAFEFRR